MQTHRNRVIAGSEGRWMPMDLFLPQNTGNEKPPLVIFAHGFKGYKDWGAWDLVAERFADAGFAFLKFNFSHNGGTYDEPIDFPDLEAFGMNNCSKELEDLGYILDAVQEDGSIQASADTERLCLIGHSRGGGIAILRAAEDPRIKKLATWAAVCDLHQRIPSEGLEEWKEEGVTYIPNARTGQQMPIYYQFYEDLMANKERLNIQRAAKELDIPTLICHGTEDPTVELKEAQALAEWIPHAETLFVEGADHAFGQKHPWDRDRMPEDLEKVVERSISFFQASPR